MGISVCVAYVPRFHAPLRGGIRDAWRVPLAASPPNASILKVIACMKTLSRRHEQLERHYLTNAGKGCLLVNNERVKTVDMVVNCTWCICGYTDDDNEDNGPYKRT